MFKVLIEVENTIKYTFYSTSLISVPPNWSTDPSQSHLFSRVLQQILTLQTCQLLSWSAVSLSTLKLVCFPACQLCSLSALQLVSFTACQLYSLSALQLAHLGACELVFMVFYTCWEYAISFSEKFSMLKFSPSLSTSPTPLSGSYFKK